MSNSGVWSFGYGANMDMVALQNKKKVKVLEHCPAILRGFRLAFSMRGPPYVEPGYGGLWREDGGVVHGVAFLMGEGGEAQLDRNEGPYLKEIVKLEAYDGRELEGYVYMTRNQTEEWLPSARYLGVLCKGARQAGLNPAYIEKLASHPVYRSEKHPEVMAARKAREAVRGSLRLVTRQELQEHRREDPWVSCLGFVIKCDPYLNRHKGRDFTSRVLMHFNGIPIDENDDDGMPPYPLVAELSTNELEYLTNWLDYYQVGRQGELIGFLKEFREQQESGITNFCLPPVPK